MDQVKQRFHDSSEPGSQLVAFELQKILDRDHPARVLTLNADRTVSLSVTDKRATLLRCRPLELPLSNQSIDMVIIDHMLADRRVGNLPEVLRVLSRDGQLIVLGRGRFSGGHGSVNTDAERVSLQAVLRQLKANNFQLREVAGFGFRGRSMTLRKTVFRPLINFSDTVLIRGRHVWHNPVATPMRFYGGLNREAV